MWRRNPGICLFRSSGGLLRHERKSGGGVRPAHSGRNGMSTAASLSSSLTEQAERACFDPADGLLGVIRRVVAAGHPASLTVMGIGELSLLPADGEYFTRMSREQLRDFCGIDAGGFVSKRLGEAEAAQLRRSGAAGRNIDELLWHAALYASDGRLMKGCRRDDVVLLKTWPNLTRIDATPNAVRIAALLTRYPTTVSLAYRLLKVPQEELNSFYSAAHAAGWALAVNRKPEISADTELKEHRARGLLGLILERVMGL